MRMYQIVKFKDQSAYATFWGCDWNCVYCIWKKEKWNLCLPQKVKDELEERWRKNEIEFLEIDRIIKILKDNEIKMLFMGGGEPTLDPQLKPLLIAMKDIGIKSWIITNAENIDDEIFELADGFTMSLKAFDRETHIKLTGHSNEKVLENFKKFASSPKVVAESVYSKGFIECEEIMKIAEFLKSINPKMRFRIDAEVGQNLDEKVSECVEKTRSILPNTYKIGSGTGGEAPDLLYP
ncbi:radical SAM protein [Athalassotoga saccharophila]|uniref:radical SAM protein n=1 Tax=Athalassotoga saccharophila TaxID=1441386 RepID=UPI0018DA2969|nr:radical SAM protein [Athalassotoga saccharophila]BBJ28358.1 7-carboxy-7-deazaguanine synthase [Athalassotoga saccharophila]